MNAQHTPTPWMLVPETLGSIEDASGHDVAQTQQRIGDKLHDERLANAAFIVKCVNSHDVLVAALKTCLDAETERSKKLLPGAPARTYTDARIEQIRAALAAAGEDA